MVNQLLGNYLVECGKLTNEELVTIFETQKQVRVKLGLIAVAEKMMTSEQADEVNRLQAVMDKRFGDIAVSKGYLTDEQVGRLLKLQGNPYLSFAQAASDKGFLELEELENLLEEYRKANGFTISDLDALKSGDVDRIVPLFIPAECEDLLKELIGVAVRTMIRLVDSDIYIGKAEIVNELAIDSIAMQALDGERKASLGFAGDGNSLLSIAVPFASEEFECVDLDALDAVAEFTNCINGLFATSVSSKVDMDMLPPSYKNEGVKVSASKLLVLPVCSKGQKFNLIATFDEIATY